MAAANFVTNALWTLSCPLAIRGTSSWAAIVSSATAAALLAFITAGGNETLLPPLGAVLLAGTAIAACSGLVGYFLVPAWFYLWMALLGGGVMIVLGLYIRRRW